MRVDQHPYSARRIRFPFCLQIIDVVHAGKPPVSKEELRKQVAKLFKVDAALVVLYGFKTAYGACPAPS